MINVETFTHDTPEATLTPRLTAVPRSQWGGEGSYSPLDWGDSDADESFV